jgi:type I site-specific restriction endonuclease
MIFHMRRMTPLAALLVLVGCQREPESCLDLFGSGQHKTCFLVFDLCANFEFFGQDLNIDDPTLPDTLTSRLVKARLGPARQLATATSDDDGVHALHTDVLDHLPQHVSTMTVDNFLVRKHRREVEQFTDRKRWDALSDEDAETVAHVLAPLPNGLEPEPPETKQFDLLMYRLMVALLDRSRAFTGYRDEVRHLAGRLEEVSSIRWSSSSSCSSKPCRPTGIPRASRGCSMTPTWTTSLPSCVASTKSWGRSLGRRS